MTLFIDNATFAYKYELYVNIKYIII